jgi:hypothetical protein
MTGPENKTLATIVIPWKYETKIINAFNILQFYSIDKRSKSISCQTLRLIHSKIFVSMKKICLKRSSFLYEPTRTSPEAEKLFKIAQVYFKTYLYQRKFRQKVYN